MEDVYEVRYGPTVKNMAMFVGSLVLASGAFMSDLSMLVRIVCGVLFGGGSVLLLAFIVSRRVAFRVDAEGVMMSGTPLRYRAMLKMFRWTEVEAIVLWKRSAGGANVRCVGVRRREDAPPAPHLGRGARMVHAALVPHVPRDVVANSVQINGWSLKADRLAAAVEHFAPDVEIVDLR